MGRAEEEEADMAHGSVGRSGESEREALARKTMRETRGGEKRSSLVSTAQERFIAAFTQVRVRHAVGTCYCGENADTAINTRWWTNTEEKYGRGY